MWPVSHNAVETKDKATKYKTKLKKKKNSVIERHQKVPQHVLNVSSSLQQNIKYTGTQQHTQISIKNFNPFLQKLYIFCLFYKDRIITVVINVVTSQATNICNTVEWTLYTTIAESGSSLFLARKTNLNPPAMNVNHSSCRQCLFVAYLITSKPSDHTESNYQMTLTSEPKGTFTEVPLSKLKAAGSLKGYNGHFT